MRDFVAVTEDDLVRARRDPAFRHKLLADNLACLLRTLNKLRQDSAEAHPNREGQIRECVDLAVKLSERLQSTTPARSG